MTITKLINFPSPSKANLYVCVVDKFTCVSYSKDILLIRSLILFATLNNYVHQ